MAQLRFRVPFDLESVRFKAARHLIALDDPLLNRLAADHVLPQDWFDPLGADAAINGAFRPDQQDGAAGAAAQVVGLGAQHDPLGPGRFLEAQLAHQALKRIPASGAYGGIGAAEGLAGSGAEQ